MLSVERQVESGRLVCPRTRGVLVFKDDQLTTLDGQYSYPLVKGVPILFAKPEVVFDYLASHSGSMVAEYGRAKPRPLQAAYSKIEGWFGDMRTPESEAAFRSTIDDLPPDALCVSVGGGPTRAHPKLINLNIGAFPNVEVVADAYALPYADDAVDAFHCEAVLEHLEHPELAVSEMYRALRPGCAVFAATPFLQPFHGYPNHFQNFTLTGHRRLFEREGFTLISSGACVGPTFALRDLVVNYLREVIPAGWIGRAVSRLLALLTLPSLWIDLFANRRPLAHQLSSTTFVVARKPA